MPVTTDDYTKTLWKREFTETIADLGDGLTRQRAVDAVRLLIASGLMAFDDIEKDPEKYFLAHRILARHVPRMGCSLWLRFSLHYNMFAGTIMSLGSPNQIRHFLLEKEVRPSLGCLALMEEHVCDRSGFVIETTATLSDDGSHFSLHTPHESAAKTWVSQGLVADEAVVIANLIVHHNSYGPHAFIVKLRDSEGELKEGITLLDMGPKEHCGDLDHARMTFDHVIIPLTRHLSRYLEVQPGAVKHPLGRKVRILNVIAQRLYTGRVITAQAALSFARSTLEACANDCQSSSVCWTPLMPHGNNQKGPTGRRRLSKGFISQAFRTLLKLEQFVARVEAQLCYCLVRRQIPTDDLQRAIAVAKVEAVETSLEICQPLLQVITGGPTTEQPDSISLTSGRLFLTCCKNNEGESHVLMQKMARDLVRVGGKAKNEDIEAALANLKEEMLSTQMSTGCSAVEAWEHCSDYVYAVSEAYMNAILQDYGCAVR